MDPIIGFLFLLLVLGAMFLVFRSWEQIKVLFNASTDCPSDAHPLLSPHPHLKDQAAMRHPPNAKQSHWPKRRASLPNQARHR